MTCTGTPVGLVEDEVLAIMEAVPLGSYSQEICDGRDNDCSGSVDDGFAVGGGCDAAGDGATCDDSAIVCEPSGAGSVCSAGVTAAFGFDDFDAGVATDQSGSGNNALVTGLGVAGSVDGRDGLELPGDDGISALRVPGSALSGAQLTVAGWFYPTGSDESESLFSTGVDGGSQPCPLLEFQVNRNGRIRVGCDQLTTAGSGWTLPADEWSHVAVTFDGAVVRSYVNGEATAVSEWDPCAREEPSPLTEDCAYTLRTAAWSSDLWIGQEQDVVNGGFDPDQAFTGYLDDIFVAAYPMTGDQVATLATGGFAALDGALSCDAGSLDGVTYYHDEDGDGFGDWLDSFEGDGVSTVPPGYIATGGDCADGEEGVFPGAAEVVGDGVDNDCDGFELCWLDADGDGYRTGDRTIASDDTDCSDAREGGAGTAVGDCDDLDADAHPGGDDGAGLGVDRDCDGTVLCYEDVDEDGYRSESTVETVDCGAPGYSYEAAPLDCDDAEPSCTSDCADIDLDEVADCADACIDFDGDGFGLPGGAGSCNGFDQDEASEFIGLAGGELCDGVDNDCDGNADEGFDSDDDGAAICMDDCSEVAFGRFGLGVELCDDIDNDCDQVVDEDCVDR